MPPFPSAPDAATDPPWTLVFDTSTATAVVAVGRGGVWVAGHQAPAPRTYDEGLLPRIEGVLAEAGIGMGAVGCIACGIGPGSFTGLRIALATAKGYVLALGCPLVTVSSTAATALAAPAGSATAVVALDAKRGQVYLQVFDLGSAAPAPPVRSAEFVDEADAAGWWSRLDLPGPVVLLGEAAERVAPDRSTGVELRPEVTAPSPAALVHLSERRRAAGETTEAAGAEPIYLRPPPFHPGSQVRRVGRRRSD